jgi:6-pyruvoyl-tetrahydropterin synthase
VELGYVGVNDVGLGADFVQIKETVGKWIDEVWDHKLILNWKDPIYYVLKDSGEVDESEMFLMRGNPTAENMAKLLAEEVIPKNWSSIARYLISIEVYETPTSSARHVVKR